MGSPRTHIRSSRFQQILHLVQGKAGGARPWREVLSCLGWKWISGSWPWTSHLPPVRGGLARLARSTRVCSGNFSSRPAQPSTAVSRCERQREWPPSSLPSTLQTAAQPCLACRGGRGAGKLRGQGRREADWLANQLRKHPRLETGTSLCRPQGRRNICERRIMRRWPIAVQRTASASRSRDARSPVGRSSCRSLAPNTHTHTHTDMALTTVRCSLRAGQYARAAAKRGKQNKPGEKASAGSGLAITAPEPSAVEQLNERLSCKTVRRLLFFPFPTPRHTCPRRRERLGGCGERNSPGAAVVLAFSYPPFFSDPPRPPFP